MTQTQDQLESLVQRIREISDRPDDASDSSEDSIGDTQTNRFNKLKRKSRYINSSKLRSSSALQSDSKNAYFGSKKRFVISSKNDEESDSDDAYAGINIDTILAPIEDPADVPTIHAFPFKRPLIPVLASHALSAISTEHQHRVHLSRLLTAFLGDDPELIMRGYSDSSKLEKEEVEVKEKTMTRGVVAADADSLLAVEFATPGYDRNLGLSGDEAEEARRLLQAALDRSEEYLRCMQRVRAGLVRADKYRMQTWRWCKDARDETQ